MKVKRTRKDIGKLLHNLESRALRVGFFDSAQYPDGTPVAYVAAIQEYGYPEGNIPARSFFRTTISGQKDGWRDGIAAGSRAMLEGKISAESMLSQIGGLAAGQIGQTISQISEPDLAESTIEARRRRRKSPGVSTKPLVDSGTLIKSVTFDVADKGALE